MKKICEDEKTKDKCKLKGSKDHLMPDETRFKIRADGTRELIDIFGNIQETPIRPNIFPNNVVPCNVKGHE